MSMKYDIEEMEKLIKLMQSYGLQEIKVKQKETEVTLKQNTSTFPTQGTQAAFLGAPTLYPATAPQMPIQQMAAQVPDATSRPTDPDATVPSAPKDGKLVLSPFVGTYYESPSPDADAFISIGQRVKKGDTLCIIEAMKIMNEIEADEDGIIKEILIKNEEPVEFEQPLFVIGKS